MLAERYPYLRTYTAVSPSFGVFHTTDLVSNLHNQHCALMNLLPVLAPVDSGQLHTQKCQLVAECQHIVCVACLGSLHQFHLLTALVVAAQQNVRTRMLLDKHQQACMLQVAAISCKLMETAWQSSITSREIQWLPGSRSLPPVNCGTQGSSQNMFSKTRTALGQSAGSICLIRSEGLVPLLCHYMTCIQICC